MATKKEKAPAIVVSNARLERIRNLEIAPLPEILDGKIDVRGWMASLFTGCEYIEPDPEGLSRDMLFQALTATSAEDILRDTEMAKLQDVLDDFPGNTTGPIRITDLYVSPSDMDEGGQTYLILTWIDLATGQEFRASTGAVILQRKLLGLICIGTWPIECQIVRDKFQDAGGRFMLNMWPVD